MDGKEIGNAFPLVQCPLKATLQLDYHVGKEHEIHANTQLQVRIILQN